jgi:hypothetical protein
VALHHADAGAHADRLLFLGPYAWRLVGVNAFALAGGAVQRFAALTSRAGTLALTGWVTRTDRLAVSTGCYRTY